MKSIYRKEYQAFIQRLRSKRLEAGLTQQQLSALLGKPQSFVSKFENGERRLDILEFFEITQAMGVDPLEIIQDLTRENFSK